MNDLKVFSSTEFGELGVMLIDGKEYFPAINCAKILGYSNPRDAVKRHCKADGVVKRDGVSYTTNQHGVTTQQVTEIKYINEGNLYRLIVSSKLPTAEKFERWVFEEVLPSIRKTGGYGTVDLEKVIAQTATAVVSEVVKQLVPVLKETIGKPGRGKTKRKAKKCTYSQPSKMELLAPEVKLQADNMLATGEYSCQQVANFIVNTTGEYISQVAVNRYKRKYFETDDDDGQLCMI